MGGWVISKLLCDSLFRGAGVTHDRTWIGSGSFWLKITPFGFRKILKFIKDEYNNPPVYVTENGISERGAVNLNDMHRTHYYKNYINQALKGIVLSRKPFLIWTLLSCTLEHIVLHALKLGSLTFPYKSHQWPAKKITNFIGLCLKFNNPINYSTLLSYFLYNYSLLTYYIIRSLIINNHIYTKKFPMSVELSKLGALHPTQDPWEAIVHLQK